VTKKFAVTKFCWDKTFFVTKKCLLGFFVTTIFFLTNFMKHDDAVQWSSAVSWYYDCHKARFRNFGGFLLACTHATLSPMEIIHSFFLLFPKTSMPG
jgi:hypothetical protein